MTLLASACRHISRSMNVPFPFLCKFRTPNHHRRPRQLRAYLFFFFALSVWPDMRGEVLRNHSRTSHEPVRQITSIAKTTIIRTLDICATPAFGAAGTAGPGQPKFLSCKMIGDPPFLVEIPCPRRPPQKTHALSNAVGLYLDLAPDWSSITAKRHPFSL